MHIGIHVNVLPTTVFINRLIEGLVKQNHRVTVFGTALKPFEKVAGANYVYFELYSFLNLSKIYFYLRYSVLVRLMKESYKRKLDAFLASNGGLSNHNKTRFYPLLWHQPDVLHVQWVKGIEQYLWVQEFGIALMASLRGTNIYMNPRLDPVVANGYRKAFPKLDGFHGVCADVLHEAAQYGLNHDKSKVIHSGLRLEDFIYLPPSKKEPSKKLRFISVGRQSWMKGYNYALDALTMVKKLGLNFHYTIIGGGHSEELMFQVADLELESEVQLIGWMSFQEVKKAIQKSDILLLPSVSEGIANTAIEAMALGTPVISSKVGGMAELISDGENGFLVPARNAAAIADAIEKWYNLPVPEKDSMARKGLDTIEERFSEDEMLAAFESLYTMNQAD